MFKWLTNLFKGASVPEIINEASKEQPVVLTQEMRIEEKVEPVVKPKKSKKGSGKCDFSKLTKTQLLAEAKHRSVKANASMKKQDILDRLNAAAK